MAELHRFREQVDRSRGARNLIRSLTRTDQRHLGRLVLFAALYLGAAGCAVGVARRFGVSWILLVNLPLYLLAAASLHGISLFTHAGVHDTLSRRPLINRVLSILCALPVLQNYAAYRVLHLEHHDDTGSREDPDHFERYTRRGWLLFLMHWARLLIGYPVYITMIPILGWRHGSWRDRAWIVLELTMMAGAGIRRRGRRPRTRRGSAARRGC